VGSKKRCLIARGWPGGRATRGCEARWIDQFADRFDGETERQESGGPLSRRAAGPSGAQCPLEGNRSVCREPSPVVSLSHLLGGVGLEPTAACEAVEHASTHRGFGGRDVGLTRVECLVGLMIIWPVPQSSGNTARLTSVQTEVFWSEHSVSIGGSFRPLPIGPPLGCPKKNLFRGISCRRFEPVVVSIRPDFLCLLRASLSSVGYLSDREKRT
jgi:hypothetical protein